MVGAHPSRGTAGPPTRSLQPTCAHGGWHTRARGHPHPSSSVMAPPPAPQPPHGIATATNSAWHIHPTRGHAPTATHGHPRPPTATRLCPPLCAQSHGTRRHPAAGCPLAPAALRRATLRTPSLPPHPDTPPQPGVIYVGVSLGHPTTTLGHGRRSPLWGQRASPVPGGGVGGALLYRELRSHIVMLRVTASPVSPRTLRPPCPHARHIPRATPDASRMLLVAPWW